MASDEDFVRNRPPSYGEFAERPFPGSPDDMMNTIAELRARVAKLEEEIAEQSKEVTNAQWSLRRAGEQEDALRARVAKLEEALRIIRMYAEEHDDEFVPFIVDEALAALKDHHSQE